MACNEYDKQLNAYFDRELDSDGREDLMGHLRTCGRCRWDFKLYRKMFQTMERMEVEPPSDLPGLVMEGIRKLSLLRFPWAGNVHFLTTPRAYGFAAAAVFMIAVLAGWQSRAPEGPVLPTATAHMTTGDPTGGLTASPLRSSPGPIRVLPEGRVQIMRRGSMDWVDAEPGDRIGYEDRVRTGEGSSVRLEYPDRAWLRIRPQSLVQVLDQAVRVFQGRTWIKVQKKGSRFEARTPNAVASVRGTIYSVAVERQELDRERLLQLAREGAAQAALDSAASPGGSNAPLSAAGAPLDMAAYLRQTLLSSFRTEVKVYESTVAVSPLDPRTGAPVSESLVPEGQGTQVHGTEVAALAPLSPEDYYAWNLPPPPKVLTAVRPLPAAEVSLGTAGDEVDEPAPPPLGGDTSTVLGTPTGDGVPDDGMAAGAAGRPGMDYGDLRSR